MEDPQAGSTRSIVIGRGRSPTSTHSGVSLVEDRTARAGAWIVQPAERDLAVEVDPILG